MNDHKHARLTPTGRLQMVRRLAAGEPVVRVAVGVGLTGGASVNNLFTNYS